MIKVAIIGYGNIGKYAVDAVKSTSDMILAGVVRQKVDNNGTFDFPVVDDIAKLGSVDAALLCIPTRNVEENAKKYLSLGLHTVDSFDIHGDIPALHDSLDSAAKKAGKVSVISAGWDPGSDSIVRALMEVCAPKGITYTNFGPGMSMGHTVVVKGKKGVKNALSMTIPAGSGVHRRMVYVELENDAILEEVASQIKADSYFAKDETHVFAVESVDAILDKGHGVNMIRKGVSGITDNQRFEFNMSINNPALTAQVMVCSVRAAARQKPGCYTMIEIPVIDYLPGERGYWIKKLV